MVEYVHDEDGKAFQVITRRELRDYDNRYWVYEYGRAERCTTHIVSVSDLREFRVAVRDYDIDPRIRC